MGPNRPGTVKVTTCPGMGAPLLARVKVAENWPAGHYSIATFELRRAGGGTVLTFTQAGVPAKNLKGIDEGWKTHYWQQLKKYFAS